MFFEVMERLICFESQVINILCKIVVDQVGFVCVRECVNVSLPLPHPISPSLPRLLPVSLSTPPVCDCV